VQSTNWQVADAGPQHIAGIRQLFRSVFGQEMSDAHWQWKYGDGRGLGVVVLQNDEVVAFFGGTERRVLFNGEPLVAMQCGDSMVAPSHRGILTRKGPFYLSVTAFLGQYVGEGLPYLLSYGFPNARAMRLAQRLELYDDVGAMLEVDWRPVAASGLVAQAFDFGDAGHRHLADELWRHMASEFLDRAIGIRDLAYLKQRFYDNPTLDYNFHLVAIPADGPVQTPHRPDPAIDAENVLGLLVTRRTDEGLLLVDMVGATANLAQLIHYARQLASQMGCRKLYGWLTERDLPLVGATDPIIEKPPLRLPLGVYSPGLSADDVRDRWFFLCGDSDFL
jgi:hypothetical protein